MRVDPKHPDAVSNSWQNGGPLMDVELQEKRESYVLKSVVLRHLLP